MQIGKKYQAEIKIMFNKAEFWLDGEPYFSCTLEPGDI